MPFISMHRAVWVFVVNRRARGRVGPQAGAEVALCAVVGGEAVHPFTPSTSYTHVHGLLSHGVRGLSRVNCTLYSLL